jgi:hypothetical protein
MPSVEPEPIAAQRAVIARTEAEWNATVFAGHHRAVDGMGRACRERTDYVRRFDPVRMALEHKTLTEERLHGRRIPDGKDVSVDLTILDEFLFPDDLQPQERARLLEQVRIRRDLLGLAEMRLVRDVRVCEYTFAYTRTSSLRRSHGTRRVRPRCQSGCACWVSTKASSEACHADSVHVAATQRHLVPFPKQPFLTCSVHRDLAIVQTGAVS